MGKETYEKDSRMWNREHSEHSGQNTSPLCYMTLHILSKKTDAMERGLKERPIDVKTGHFGQHTCPYFVQTKPLIWEGACERDLSMWRESTQCSTRFHRALWRCTFCQKSLILWKESHERDPSVWSARVHQAMCRCTFCQKRLIIWKESYERDLSIWSVHRAMWRCTFCQKRLIIWIEAYERCLFLSMIRESTQSSIRVHHANVAHFGHLSTTITRMNESIHIHKKAIT